MSFYTNVLDRTKLYLKNVDQNKLVNKYIPTLGSSNYLLLSTGFMTPELFSKVFGGFSLRLSNVLWLNSFVGSCMYLYSRSHMRKLKRTHAIGYSLFGSLLFNFGSFTFWVFSKSYLIENNFLLFVYGLLTGSGLLYAGKSYLKEIDENSKE